MFIKKIGSRGFILYQTLFTSCWLARGAGSHHEMSYKKLEYRQVKTTPPIVMLILTCM